MTMSAFGVEHIEIGKARGDRAARRAAQGRALSAQQQAALHFATGKPALGHVERAAQRFHEAQAAAHTPKALTALRRVVGKRDYDAAQRRDLEAKGDARPGGRFPIANAEDLHNALRRWGNAKPADRAFIRRRAAQLGVSLSGTGYAGSGEHGSGDSSGRKMFAEQHIGKSAFGVEHYEPIGKADDDRYRSAGRTATTLAFPVYHGLVAGRKGKKLRAAGNEFGSGFLGALGGESVGAGLGALVAHKAPGAGALIGGLTGGEAGSIAGVLHGQKRNVQRGYLKPVGSNG